MFEYTSPEKVGIDSLSVENFIKNLENYGFCTHSIIMARNNKIFCEAYFKPYNKDSLNRIYSVTKSFTAVAIGFLIDEGKLSLDDKILKFFPEKTPPNDYLKDQTIEDMLKMQTSFKDSRHWIDKNLHDRTDWYFSSDAANAQHSSMLFQYDSHGSYMLGTVAERVSGMPLFDYLKKKCLNEIGFSKNSYCLKAVGGNSWSDSAILCTSLDLLKFGKFVSDGGSVNGRQLISKEYITRAVSPLVFNGETGYNLCNTQGYGYQIWRSFDNSFAFVGMGDQYVVCVPDKDFIFVMTSDNQGNPHSRPLIFHMLFNDIVRKLSPSALQNNDAAYNNLKKYLDTRKLFYASSNIAPNISESVNNKTFVLDKNVMEIEYMRFVFNDNESRFEYKNKQGEKILKFGINKNIFSDFPQTGYSDETGGVSCPDNKYKCAASACWVEPSKLFLKVQIIDKYLGNLNMTVSFKDDKIAVHMISNAEGFLCEYNGFASGRLK